MKRYTNVYCDTAFTGINIVRNLIKQGVAAKILTGSDFPITHYYNKCAAGLYEQYASDLEQLKEYETLINASKV
jgi:predicted TIM-barrel fold metal-dependent hydrolase